MDPDQEDPGQILCFITMQSPGMERRPEPGLCTGLPVAGVPFRCFYGVRRERQSG